MIAQEDIDFVLDRMLYSAIDAGRPPGRPAAWLDACEKNLREIEEDRPGYIARVANGMRARDRGERITGWRETRGTHGMDYVPDPEGTARPPWA